MENKTWIERLLLFIPKSKYNVGILWNEELKCNIIDIYVPGPYIEVEYYLFYDNVKSIYNVGDHVCDWHSEGGYCMKISIILTSHVLLLYIIFGIRHQMMKNT